MHKKTRKLLEELYDTHVDALYRYAFLKLQSHDQEALDIVQESFYKLWLELENGKDIENPKSYIYRMVSNKIIDFYRKNIPVSLEEQVETFGDIYAGEINVEALTKTKLEIEEVYKILSWLKDFDQDIFLLRFVEWFTPKEIAEKFDMSVNVITVQLHRLKQKIKSKSKFKFI